MRIENFWGISLEMVQSPELYQLLDYVPLFDNLRFESFIDRNYGSNARVRNSSFYSKNGSSENKNSGGWVKEEENAQSENSVDLMKESIRDILGKKEDSNRDDSHREDSYSDFGGADFGLYGFNEESEHILVKSKQKRPKIKTLALRFIKSHDGINYLEVEKYLEAIVGLLGEVGFSEYPELVAVSDFTIMNEKIDKKEYAKTDLDDEEVRSIDYRLVNKKVLTKVEFQIKDELNDLMENASLTNILMDLNEIQNKFLIQEKSKLNFLNTLIYSVDFSELMSLLFEYSIRLLKEEIEEEEQKEKIPGKEEKSKTDLLVFLIMKMQFKILLGLAELRLFELFHRELNLKFEEIKMEKMEKMRIDIKEQISMYFSKPLIPNFSILILSKRISMMLQMSNSEKGKLDKLEELGNIQSQQESIIMIDKTKSQIDFLQEPDEDVSSEEDWEEDVTPEKIEPKVPEKGGVKNETNFSFKTDSHSKFMNKIKENNETIRRARENLDELISIRQIVNDTNTNFSISETSDHTLLNMLNITFGIKGIVKSQIKEAVLNKDPHINHIKSKSNNFMFDQKKLKNRETELEKLFKVDSKGNFNREIISDIRKQMKESKFQEGDSKISSLIIENIMNNSNSFFSQGKQSKDELSEIDEKPDTGVKIISSDQSNKSDSISESKVKLKEMQDSESGDKTVPHTRLSLKTDDMQNPRATSKKEILIPFEKLHEERPTYKPQKTDEHKEDSEQRVSIEKGLVSPQKVETIEIFFKRIPLNDILGIFENEYSVDKIKFNEVNIIWTNFEELIKSLDQRFPQSRLQVEDPEIMRKKVQRKLRNYRSKIDGLKCNVMKVQKKYLAFFDQKFYSIIQGFCDVEYMRKQINLLMLNKKFILIETKGKVQNVKFTKPIYMNQLVLKSIPLFR